MLGEYLKLTRRHIEALDQRVITVLSASNVPARVIRAYERELGDFVIGCQEGYAVRRPPGWFVDHGLAWARSLMYRHPRYGHEQVMSDLADIARKRPERPLFVPFHLFCYSQDISDAKKWTEELPPQFEVLRPDEF